MKMCYMCGRESVIEKFTWKNDKCILVERCCNPYCKTYDPYLMRGWNKSAMENIIQKDDEN